MTPMDINDIRRGKITELVQQLGSQKAIAEALDCAPNYISRIIGGTKNLSGDMARVWEAKLGLPPYTLDGIRVLREKTATNDLGGSSYEPVPVQTGRVPVLGIAQLGADGFWAVGDLGAGGGAVEFASQDEQAYALKVVGDSMHPRIKSGEYVVAEPSHAYGAGDEVVVVTTDGRAMVKEFVYRRDGQVALNSVNNGHGRLTLAEGEIESIHYVVAITKPSLFRPG